MSSCPRVRVSAVFPGSSTAVLVSTRGVFEPNNVLSLTDAKSWIAVIRRSEPTGPVDRSRCRRPETHGQGFRKRSPDLPYHRRPTQLSVYEIFDPGSMGIDVRFHGAPHAVQTCGGLPVLRVQTVMNLALRG